MKARASWAGNSLILLYASQPELITGKFGEKLRMAAEIAYCEPPVFDLPSRTFTIRDMISVHAYQTSRGREIVYSYPFRCLTVFPIASRHGLACGFRLKFM